jgi:hypothetical protein
VRFNRFHISPSMVVAIAALVVAAGGTSYAALKLPAKSVGSRQLKNNAVVTAKIKNDAVTGAKVNEATLGVVPAAASAGITGLVYAHSDAALAPHTAATVHGDCPAGLSPLSGGARVGDLPTMFIIDTYPQGSGWTINIANVGDAQTGFTFYVVCGRAGPEGGPVMKAIPSKELRHYRLAR